MNRQRYRIVFSRHLGALVAVAECARAQGKAASGARGAVALASALLFAAPGWTQNLPVPGAGGGIPNFVTAGQAAYQVTGHQAFVNQVGNKAILNWQSFNVGAGHGVQFRQVQDLNTNQLVQGASFTTLNRIWDINPSVIAGAISQADGQKANIILVNTNGIAFLGGSQVNLNSFTASTLNIADKYIINGLLGDLNAPQFERGLDGGEGRGAIQVMEGAKISATSQGRVMLIAPRVENRGSISAPDGQVILAAGSRVFLRADDSADLNLRGLLVEVDSPAGGGSVASNFGQLTAERGNVTMVGYAVNQMGRATATSSVLANGSVYLMAKDTSVSVGGSRSSSRGGEVVLGAGSVTEVLPDLSDKTTVQDGDSGTGLAEKSQVRVLGQKIHMESGAAIVANAGDVAFTAVDNPTTLVSGGSLNGAGSAPSTQASIHIAQGARIDVSGLRDVEVSAARNTVEVELRGDELKDSPVNQNGPLRGQKAWVDIEQALANADAGKDTLIARDSLLAYRARLERGIAERSTQAGTISLRSEGQTIVEQGASFDLSGGSVKYTQDVAKTTVLSSRGKLTDLADASASTRYDAIVSRYVVNYDKWNEQEVIELPSAQRVVQGYTQGQDAGRMNVQSMGAAYFSGSVEGRTVAGERQQLSGQLPRGATLTFGTEGVGDALKDHKLNQNVVIANGGPLPGQFARHEELVDPLKDTLTLDAALVGEGRVAQLEVFTNQAAEVRDALRTPQGGGVTIAGRQVNVNADITAQGGHIDITARNNARNVVADTTLSVRDGVALQVQGAWVNQRRGVPGGAGVAPVIDGGSVSLVAQGQASGGLVFSRGTVALGEGVRIDADGGGRVDQGGQLHAGRGGDITIGGNHVQGLDGATLRAHGIEAGGSLALTSERVQIGGSGQGDGLLVLGADAFQRGGFAQYDIRGLQRLDVVDGAQVDVRVQQIDPDTDALTRPSGSALASVGRPVTRDAWERPAASIALSAGDSGAGTGELRIGQGARVDVDPGGLIELEARNSIEVEGALVARGGTIDLTLDRSSGFSSGSLETNTLWLGANARLDASGTPRITADDKGLTQGEVLAGGTVNLNARTGYLVAEQGATIDVSGSSPVQYASRDSRGVNVESVASGAGQVNLFAEEGLLFDATLAARGGAPDRQGGALSVTLSKTARVEGQSGYDSLARTMVLSNTVAPQTAGLDFGDSVPLTGEVRASIGTDALEAAGFEQLRFSSRDGIALEQGLALGDGRAVPLREIQLDAARIETRGDAHLMADAVRLGNWDASNRGRVGTEGSSANNGVLRADARLLELAGNVRLRGMQRSELTGSERVQLAGVTRLDAAGAYEHSATIATTGDLTLRGGSVSPTSFADVTIQAAGRDVRVESTGVAAPVWSAAGSLRVEAQNITQAGRVIAPLGSIDLVAQNELRLEAGSLTSVAADAGQVLPLGQIQNGTQWVVNLNPADVPGGQLELDALPEKAVNLSGGSVQVKEGATINVAGGGDVQAYEFSVGPGGSRDILAAANTYAIVPGYAGGFAPGDPQEGLNRAVGTTVYLSGVPGLPAGTYTLLPAHYALLPGALAVRLGESVAVRPEAFTRQDGIQVTSGYLTDSRAGATREGGWRAIDVLTQDQVRARSEFTLARASGFFGTDTLRPQDAGRLSMLTQGQLELDGRLIGSPAAGGRGAAVDIAAPNLVIAGADATGIDPTATRLNVDDLNALGAESLLLGATRERDGNTTTLTVHSEDLRLANGGASALRGPEVMLAARDTLTLAEGSAIDAQGADGDAGHYATAGNGAFVRAASSAATFSRTGSPDRSQGTLNADHSAVVQAARSINLDATRDNAFAGDTRFARKGQAVAGELAVGAARVNLGSPVGAVEGITFSQDDFDDLLGLRSLTLSSYTTFDVYGSVDVGGRDANGAPTLQRLSLQGGGIAGAGGAGDQVRLAARDLSLSNQAGAAYNPGAAAGAGTLTLQADTLTLGAGDKTMGGFSGVAIDANTLNASGTGTTRLDTATTVTTARLTGEAGAKQTLELAAGLGTLALSHGGAAAPSGAAGGLGAGWTLRADAIDFDTRAQLASGSLELHARTGDVQLGDRADVNVAGRELAFFDEKRGTWGGQVTLRSDSGNVALDAASRVDVSGAAGADGGTLNVSAVNGTVSLPAGTLRGETLADAQGKTGKGAVARVDANTLANADAINTALGKGFTGERALRARTGDLSIGANQTVRAERIALSADAGSIDIRGTLDANGTDGGHISAYAGHSLTLHDGARLDASATQAGGDGGRVELGAGSGGALDLAAGSRIDVRAGAGGEAGRVNLRAMRAGNDVAVTALDSTILGAGTVDIEAVRVYEGISTLNATGGSSGSTLSLTTINADNTAYAANHGAIKARLGLDGNPAVHIVSGTEVRSSGDLTVANDWNLASATAGDEPGVLTLRAQGNLQLNGHLSDGFTNAAPMTGTTPSTLLSDTVRGGRSWSYRLVAGADASAADPLSTRAGVGDVTVAAGKVVRTGTGHIDVAAGRDIKLASATSAIYTAGRLSPALDGFTPPITLQRAYFTQGGGDLSLQAGRDITGVASSQLYSEWLFRQGRLNADGSGYLTGQQGTPAWWVRFDQFAQGVGALGGGDVSLRAGGNVNNVSASAPTQGRMASGTPDAAALVKTGGGHVTVEAGGDVLGGHYMADEGSVRVVAGGAIDSGQTVLTGKVYPVIALGNASAEVRATGDVNLHGVINPQLVIQSYGANDNFNVRSNAQGAQRESVFSTYGSDSAVRLSSLNGDTVLHDPAGSSTDGVSALYRAYSLYGDTVQITDREAYRNLLGYLPPSMSMTAFNGDVVLSRTAVSSERTMMPSTTGQLELMAQDSVLVNVNLVMSDNDPSQVASAWRPTNLPGTVLSPTVGQRHANTPVHTGDSSTAKVYAVQGDVRGVSQSEGQNISLDLAKSAEVRAGRDVVNLNLAVQHANTSDRSVVEAGRDIRYADGGLRSDADGLRVAGQGRMTVAAGRNISLGTSGGILSRGDLDNANLPATGADLEVIAGLGPKGFDVDGALARLQQRLASGSPSETDLALARWLTGDASLTGGNAAAAVADVAGLPHDQRHDRVREFVFTALRTTGRDANDAGSGFAGDFERGYAALELVFPGIGTDGTYQGDLNLFASRIKTERGGGIDVMVPGGGIVVGLANTPANLVNVGNNVLGIVAAAEGDVRAMAREDVLVNQSRVLTVGGGDVLLWSSEGDIDAGRGAKTASAVPPPIVKVDPGTGTVTQELVGAASGSGIGALESPGVEAGDVDLIAPKGTVNAGDAGIRARNLNIAAQVVLGADNISVSGTSTGTPVADTSAVTADSSGATSGGNDASSVVESLNQAAAESARAAQELASSLRPSVVRVEVLGFGE
ncbi:MAG: filamentous hemagglutinin N-terminal domain-containing protein [Hydrogenophaga sp.]|uniref:filamentous haemagglutinin family protein n=1 Tax=Hydrogenophaga sp. TaxID=1904254 RepID=UPI001698A523|nr:filamentous haemagglutinin family protein [Hydrogenophaga sp.]NIM40977.1 filamentous hemagglutinin N-terminal domain-containing protein [Hydrogenophaga sp.]NIN26335.1 filamentous hemagglutinin N-terminal domain-containing protein [Hydrogenophaga sp.]NIN31210.1 filamentous hemagglutinin N-terminal domain-containing protein [Hydrogenophaga sp.]NIN55249.1 filamentous hemagglutinin N-terminal domain-containing protein [Hydrogenophaga sp.]NIO53633.1 filamentous hemagglutinin N-terminal domain-co